MMSLKIKINEAQKHLYYQKGYWGVATLGDYWKSTVLRVPEKVAVVDFQGTRFTYAELDDAADRVAAFLKDSGVQPGDFVSMQLPGWSEFTIIYIACLKVGAVVNPILPNLREAELTYMLNKCESKVFFLPSHFRKFDYPAMLHTVVPQVPSLRKVVIVEKDKKVDIGLTFDRVLNDYEPLSNSVSNGQTADDVAAVLFTSGTEGHPKGVMLTHNNIISSEKSFASALNLSDSDVVLMPSPVAHATGFHHGVTVSFLMGATNVLLDIFKPASCIQLIERERCTSGMGCTAFVYDILRELNKNIYDISSLRFFLCGGAPIPRHIVKAALEKGFKVLGVYGSTESVPHTVSRIDDPIETIICTDGKALPGIDVRVVDGNRQPLPSGSEGEEASRGPNVFVGYLKEEDTTDRVLDDEGWYYSGDLCTMDPSGHIRITGRKKDIIIRGGENISSSEVESILLQHPNIIEVGVVGMPDPRLGERTCAYVVLEDRSKELTLDDVKQFFKELNVATYKWPERVEIVASLPRTESGKVKKFLLREDIQSKLNKELAVLLDNK